MNTFYHGDCLFVLQHDIPPESIDLIYLDPPFFTGKIQRGKWQPGAMEISYEDSKRFWAEKSDVMREKAPMWMRHVALKQPDFASYLYYMMQRLDACHKVLNNKGSIYLHCDYRASHYLKMIMDEIFTHRRFLSEIIWYYHRWTAITKNFQRMHDTIFRYSKTKDYTFNQLYEDYQQTTLKYHDWQIDEEGKKYYVKKGRTIEPYRVYIDEQGVKLSDVWELPQLGPIAKERVGYPTQKPELLLERIIQSSSNEGNLVLDPFCGCGTTLITASKLNRNWIGIDIDTSPREPNKLPTAFQVITNRSHTLFQQANYITRDISEVQEMDGRAFELWVNEYCTATKPQPDRGVDGITQEGVPIQSKVYEIKYAILSQFINDAKYHPLVPKPVKKIMAVSQSGFDDSARKLKFQIETTEGIEVILATPEDMIKLGSESA